MAKNPQLKGKKKAEREARAAAALRDNLRRRKAVRRTDEPEENSGDKPEDAPSS